MDAPVDPLQTVVVIVDHLQDLIPVWKATGERMKLLFPQSGLTASFSHIDLWKRVVIYRRIVWMHGL